MTPKQSQWKELLSSSKRVFIFVAGIAVLLSTFIINYYVSTYVE